MKKRSQRQVKVIAECEAAKGIIEMRVTMKKVNNKEVI